MDTAEEWASQGQILVDLHLKRAGVCDANPITIRFLRHINSSLFKRTVRKKKKNIGQTVAVFFLTSEKDQKSLCIQIFVE